MHGRRTEVDEPFVTPEGFHIMWPADCTSGSSDVPQKEIRNCRCTLLSRVKGFEGDTVTSSPDMGDMTFEEWQNAKTTRNQEFTFNQNDGIIRGNVSDQNTGRMVSYNPSYDYTIAVEKYSDEVSRALSMEAAWLAEQGTKDKVEWLSLVDTQTGEVLYREKGEDLQTGANFWDYILSHSEKKIAFLHNHVFDGAISAPDMEIMLTSDSVDCVVAIRNDAVICVAPRNDRPTPNKMLFMLYGDKTEAELVALAIRDYTRGYYEHDGRR